MRVESSQIIQTEDLPVITTSPAPPLVSVSETVSEDNYDSPKLTDASANRLPEPKTAPIEKSKAAPLTIKLLGKLKDRLPAGEFLLPHRCAECGTTLGMSAEEMHCARCRLNLCFRTLVADRRLSVEAWEQIRRLLSLPAVVEKLPVDKSRSVYQLLNSFVSRFSFIEQNAMTGAEVAKRLSELPDLPPVFIKQAKAKAAMGRGVLNRATQNAASAKRKPISAKLFLEVAARQGSFCYWCGIKVVREAQIPQQNRLIKNTNTIVYYAGDELREEAVGTIDHLLRVTDGGDNNPVNLVISCSACNQEREQATLAYSRPFARRRLPCHNCGGRFFHPDWGCCSICGAVPERAREPVSWFGYLIELMKRWRRVE